MKMRRAVQLAGLLACALALYALRYDWQSYKLLTRLTAVQSLSSAPPPSVFEIPTATAPIRSRLYLPTIDAPVGSRWRGVVLLHGMHRLGIDEPRLTAFARALSGSGFAVLTPQLDALTQFRVDASTIPQIGFAAQWLEQRLDNGPVVIVAVSFAGGLALLTATQPQWAVHMKLLVVVGGYDDLADVMRFEATDEANQYGSLIFVLGHVGQFFAPADTAVAHDAIEDWLHEDFDAARKLALQLTPAGQSIMTVLFLHRQDQIRPRMLPVISSDADELANLSPRGKLASISTPVFLLHGASDDVIPASQTAELRRDVPRRWLAGTLVTGAFGHVNPGGGNSWARLQLVLYFARILRAMN